MKESKRLKFSYICGVVAAIAFGIAALIQMKSGNTSMAVLNGICSTVWFVNIIIYRAKYNKSIENEGVEVNERENL